jgi:hypothetical protein
MALKMKENFQKSASAAAKQLNSPANVYINRAGRAVSLAIAPITQKNNQEKLPKDSEDVDSIKGKQLGNTSFEISYKDIPNECYFVRYR